MLAFNHLGKLGRLGNQMFQYASLRGIAANRGYDFGIPPSNFRDVWQDHQLFQVFELHHLPPKNVRILDNGYAPVAKEVKFGFDELLFNQCPNEISIWGFFQSEKYFNHIKQSIKEDFIFRQHILEPCKEMMSQFNTAPVSLHIRRTDYITSPNHTALSLDYYKKALDIIGEYDYIFVFSDDIQWCKNNLTFNNMIFMEGFDDVEDLWMMSMCKNNIIANSTFSWWGAWLNNNENKQVIIPSKWFGISNSHLNTNDLYCDKWIKL
jgi:hypothetical protein